jgi:hypothetical protein
MNELEIAKKSKISKFFVPKNAGKVFEDKLSPDGKYRIVIAPYATKKDCWNFSQGLVFRVGSDKPLFEVQRNYCSFPYSWIDHPNSHQYLVCGEDYQGQTVLELDTGKRLDFVPTEAKDGVGFCWANYRFDVTSKILVVCGCIWACPYEFRFYDFSDPMNGWPEITIEDSDIDEDPMWPVFESEDIVKAYSTRSYDDEDDEDDDNKPAKPKKIRAIKILKREGLKFKLLDEEVSEEEKTRRKEQEEYQRLYEEKMKLFKESDPLYLCHCNLIKDPAFSPEDHFGIGITHKDWCPHFKIEEQRFCRRIVSSKKLTIDLEWGMVSGPIKLVIYKKGKSAGDKWFEHSVDGMTQAFKTIKDMQSTTHG